MSLLFLLACTANDEESAAATTDCFSSESTGWSEASHTKGDGDYDTVFPSDKVQRLDLSICAGDYAVMKADLDTLMGSMGAGGPPDSGAPPNGGPPADGAPPSDTGADEPSVSVVSAEPVFVPATLSFDGRTWPSAGVRYKGNSSLTSYSAGIEKLPLRLDLDQYEDEVPETDDQRFYGFQKLSLGPAYMDDSFIREVLAGGLIEDAGLPVARSSFWELWVDVGEGPVYWGLYTMVEDPENKAFLDRSFGENDGNLYQPEDGCADWTCFDAADFSKETNDEAADWSDVEAAIATLSADRSDAAAWRAELETYLDVDSFLSWLALSTAIGNWDSYGLMPHNYFLYANAENKGRLEWISWDHNMTLNDGMMPILDIDLAEVTEEWPLIRYVLDDPEYAARYEALLAEQQAVLDIDAFSERALALHDLVTPYVEAEAAPYSQLSDLDAFYDSVEGEAGLVAWMEERNGLVTGHLSQ